MTIEIQFSGAHSLDVGRIIPQGDTQNDWFSRTISFTDRSGDRHEITLTAKAESDLVMDF